MKNMKYRHPIIETDAKIKTNMDIKCVERGHAKGLSYDSSPLGNGNITSEV
jgi:hypothetical protein